MVLAALVVLQSAIHEPKNGSAERKELMDALRPTIERDLKQKVIFEVKWLRSNGHAAFLWGYPRQKNGKPIDYKKTHHAEDLRNGVFDDGVCALLRKGKKSWKPTFWQVGMTDVPWDGMWERERLPRALFPH